LTTTSPAAQRQVEAAGRRAASWILLLGFFLIDGLARGVYWMHGERPSARFEILAILGFVSLLWYWLMEQCRPHRVAFPLDIAYFAAALWFLLVPYYLWHCQRWRGLLKVLCVFGAYATCYGLGVGLYYMYGEPQ
jgi:hypothetical protein